MFILLLRILRSDASSEIYYDITAGISVYQQRRISKLFSFVWVGTYKCQWTWGGGPFSKIYDARWDEILHREITRIRSNYYLKSGDASDIWIRAVGVYSWPVRWNDKGNFIENVLAFIFDKSHQWYKLFAVIMTCHLSV